MDEKLGPNNIVDIGLVRSEVILYIVKFVLIGIDVKAFGVPQCGHIQRTRDHAWTHLLEVPLQPRQESDLVIC